MSLVAYALTSVADVKANLDIATGNTAWDTTVFPLLINAATDWIERFCGGRRFVNAGTDLTEYYESSFQPGAPTDRINKFLNLKNWPIVSVTSVAFRVGLSPWSGATQPTQNYDVYSEQGQIYFRTGIPRGPQAVQVVYQGGYASNAIPSDLQYACIKIVSKEFARRKAEGKKTEQSGGNSVGWSDGMDAEVVELLSKYRRFL